MRIKSDEVCVLPNLQGSDRQPQNFSGAGGSHPVYLISSDTGAVQPADLLQKRTHAHFLIYADPVVAAAAVCAECYLDTCLQHIGNPGDPVGQKHIA
ncbi:hypothetical protein D3C85_1394100 [compost metagenome]